MEVTGENLVLDALTRAVSQQVSELKTAEAQLSEWETQPGFYSILLRVISNHSLDPTVRWMAALSFKNGVDRYWRKTAPNAISEEEKAILRAGLLEAFKEPINQVAVQLAVLIAKAARFDCPKEWPELIPTLLGVVLKEDDLLIQHRAFLVLHHVIKTLASKRLAGDRRLFQQLTTNIYTVFCNLNNSIMDTFFIQVQNNDPNCHGTLEKALLILRILRKLTVFGFKEPKASQDVITFLSSVFDRAKNCLLVRKRVESNVALRELLEKVVIHLTKVLLSVLEHHPFSFIPFITPSLSFTVSLLFTPEGEGLLFERFVVQCLNLMKGILLCAEYKLSSGSSEEEKTTSEAAQATQKKVEFFQQNVVAEICRKLVTHYFLLNREELELWDSDPEGFMNEEGGESWKYNLRPCMESLFMALFREHRDTLSPVLLELVYSNHQPVNPQDLQAVLRKDAVYLAAGLAAFDLYDEIDMDQWFTTLLQELAVEDPNYRIIKRRATWLLGEWSGVKFSQQMRPALYRSLIPLLRGEEDMAVRLTAANSLKISIDDFDFDPDQFMEFLEPAFSLLFNLLKEAKECDTKMHVLTVLSFIVERVGEGIRPHSSSLIQYLPLLWDESSNHDMLRCAIVSTLVHCVRALVADELTSFLYPVLEVCVDISQEPHVYLLEDGLELWLAMLQNSSSLSPPMLHLAKRLPVIMDASTEHTQPLCHILIAYITISPREFMLTCGEGIFSSIHEALQEVNAEGVATMLPVVLTALKAEPTTAIHLTMPIVQYVFLRVYKGGDFPRVMTLLLAQLSRILLHSRELFFQIVESVSQMENVTPDSALDRILSEWLEQMPLVTEKEKRKLLTLALGSLMTARSNVVLNRLTPLLRNIVESLNDIVDLDQNNRKFDTLFLAELEGLTSEEPEYRLETAHERRLKLLSESDPVYNVAIHDFLQSQVNELKLQIGEAGMESLLHVIDTELLNQFRFYIDI